MGRQTAYDLIDTQTPYIAMLYHLTENHYPPLPKDMVDVCWRAIKNANAGNWDKRVRLPKSVKYKGISLAPTRDVIEAHHLEPFLDSADDDDDYWPEDEEDE